MDRLDATVPPVVAVMVVHFPSPTLDVALAGLAAQDYPDLRVLVLATGSSDGPEIVEVRERTKAVLPDAVVRSLDANPGWGPACNVALDLVEGDHGFFALLHDDVALEPDALRILVEETYRSNAGIVGPKLVEWDDPHRLQRVGLAVDRIGEIDPLVEPGERDQEQYDAVRDVFAVPSACMLIRADLFRLLRFDDRIDFHGEDLDLCWRAHLSGARVLVVPAARARHRGRLPERREDLSHRSLIARHRVWSVATLTGWRRLPGVLMRLIVVTIAEFVVGIVTGRARDSWAILTAVAGLAPRSGAVLVRRRRLASLRAVPDHEVAHLQMSGSARWRRFRRARETPSGAASPRGRESWVPDLVTWLVAVGIVAVGSRHLITGGVGHLGEMIPLPPDPGEVVRDYLVPWWSAGGGAADPAPTGLGLLGLAGLVAGGRMAMVHTLGVLIPVLVGLVGLWRIGSHLGDRRAQRVTVLAGALAPGAYGAITTGRWSVLAVWSATPWVVHALMRSESAFARRFGSIEDSAPGSGWRAVVGLGVVTAVVGAFVPIFAVMVLVMALAAALGSWWGSSDRVGTRTLTAAVTVVSGGAAVALAVVMHLPWSIRLGDPDRWAVITGGSQATSGGWGLSELAMFGRSGTALGGLGVIMLVPLVVAPLVARAGTARWALRAGCIAGVFAVVAALADRGGLPFEIGAPQIWAAPVASMAAVATGVLMASWRREILPGGFGWRQPVGIAAGLCVVLGAFPIAVGVFDGRWDQPRGSLSVLLEQLPDDDATYRTVFVGDPAVLPVAARALAEDVAVALVDGGGIDPSQRRWLTSSTPSTRLVHDAFVAMSTGASARLGRALAPVGVRYVVVPLVDGSASTLDRPRPVPEGLLEAIDGQLDLRRISSTSEVVIYENTVWLPVRGILDGSTARASQQAGLDALVAADLSRASSFGAGEPPRAGVTGSVAGSPVSVLHLAVPRSVGWRAVVDGEELTARPSFGAVTAWDLPAEAELLIALEPPDATTRILVVILQALVWAFAIAVATGVSTKRWFARRSRSSAAVAPDPVMTLTVAGPATGGPTTGGPATGELPTGDTTP